MFLGCVAFFSIAFASRLRCIIWSMCSGNKKEICIIDGICIFFNGETFIFSLIFQCRYRNLCFCFLVFRYSQIISERTDSRSKYSTLNALDRVAEKSNQSGLNHRRSDAEPDQTCFNNPRLDLNRWAPKKRPARSRADLTAQQLFRSDSQNVVFQTTSPRVSFQARQTVLVQLITSDI